MKQEVMCWPNNAEARCVRFLQIQYFQLESKDNLGVISSENLCFQTWDLSIDTQLSSKVMDQWIRLGVDLGQTGYI